MVLIVYCGRLMSMARRIPGIWVFTSQNRSVLLEDFPRLLFVIFRHVTQISVHHRALHSSATHTRAVYKCVIFS